VYSRVLVECAEEELLHAVEGRVRGRCFAAVEAELAGVPRHGTEEFARVLWSSDNLRKEVEAMQGTWKAAEIIGHNEREGIG
jgi:hypothetical protein